MLPGSLPERSVLTDACAYYAGTVQRAGSLQAMRRVRKRHTGDHDCRRFRHANVVLPRL